MIIALSVVVIILCVVWLGSIVYEREYVPRYGKHPLGWAAKRRYMRHPVVKELRRPITLKKLPISHTRLLDYVCPKCGKPMAHRRYSIGKAYPNWGDVRCEACGFKHDLDYRQRCNGGDMFSSSLSDYCLSTYEKSVVKEAERRLMADWDKRFASGEALPPIALPRNYTRDRRLHA